MTLLHVVNVSISNCIAYILNIMTGDVCETVKYILKIYVLSVENAYLFTYVTMESVISALDLSLLSLLSQPSSFMGFLFHSQFLNSVVFHMSYAHIPFAFQFICHFFQIFNFVLLKFHWFLPYRTVLINSLASKINAILCHIY
jgi:hypothetical protein